MKPRVTYEYKFIAIVLAQKIMLKACCVATTFIIGSLATHNGADAGLS